jgi:nicotinamidase/pyrazinamidase
VSVPLGPATALIVADLQNDFADPAGSLHVPGGEALPATVNALVRAVRTADGLVVYTQDWHPPHTPHFAVDGGIWPVHCVAGTPGAELHPGLIVAGPIVRKGTQGEDGYSGFTMRDPASGATLPTRLDPLLRGRGIRRVLVCGLATDYCVDATAADALRLGYETTLLLGAIRAVDLQPGDGARAIERLAAAGVHLQEGLQG